VSDAPTPAPIVDEDEPMEDSTDFVVISPTFRYFLLSLVILVVPSAAFILCGGRQWLRQWIRETGIVGGKRIRSGGYHKVVDLEK